MSDQNIPCYKNGEKMKTAKLFSLFTCCNIVITVYALRMPIIYIATPRLYKYLLKKIKNRDFYQFDHNLSDTFMYQYIYYSILNEIR